MSKNNRKKKRTTPATTSRKRKPLASQKALAKKALVEETRSHEKILSESATKLQKYSSRFDEMGFRYLTLVLVALHIFCQFLIVKFSYGRGNILWIPFCLEVIGFSVYAVLKFFPARNNINEKLLWRRSRWSFLSVSIGIFGYLMLSMYDSLGAMKNLGLFFIAFIFLCVAFFVIVGVFLRPYRLLNVALTRFGTYCVAIGLLVLALANQSASQTILGSKFSVIGTINVCLAAACCGTLLIVDFVAYKYKPKRLYNFVQYVVLKIANPAAIASSIIIERKSLAAKIHGIQLVHDWIKQGKWMELKSFNEEATARLSEHEKALLGRIPRYFVAILGILISWKKDFFISMLEPIIQKYLTEAFAVLICKYFGILCDFKIQ